MNLEPLAALGDQQCIATKAPDASTGAAALLVRPPPSPTEEIPATWPPGESRTSASSPADELPTVPGETSTSSPTEELPVWPPVPGRWLENRRLTDHFA
eukprot:g29177.t1